MKLRHSKSSTDDVDSATESMNAATSSDSATGGSNWKCPSCGAENEDFRKFCDGCGDKRPGATVASKGISMDEILGSGGSTEESSTNFEDADKPATPKKGKKEKKGKKSKKEVEDEDISEPPRLEPSTPASQWFDSGKDQSGDDFESKSSFEPKADSGSKPSFVLTGPEPTPSSDDTFAASAPTPPSTPSFSTSSEPLPSGQRYYMVFVNTPASSLIKTRVLMEFDDFPSVTIGRSPENVVVIPDPEVSRKHASLNYSGNRLVLKDLGSSNGTFVYNGKEFERVSDSVEVRPNTVLKFGTGTIVKLVSE